jgi:hypothetical protein
MSAWAVRWARIGAVLLLAAICADVANVHCDGSALSIGRQNLVVAVSQTDGGDACGATCVPDCFCCSRTVQCVAFELRPQSEPPAPCTVGEFPRLVSGVRSLPYHPPLNLL